MQKHFIWIIILFITSPIFSQTDINHNVQTYQKSIDSILRNLPESMKHKLQLPILIIDNPKWLEYIDVYDKVSNDFFTTEPFQEWGINNLAYNNNFTKIYSGVRWGFFVGIVGALIGSFIDNKKCGEDEFDCKGLLIGGLISYHLGTPYGVYKVGNRSNENGSYAAAFLGGIAGHLIGIAALTVSQNAAVGIFWFVSAPIGATIGYNISR